MVIHEDKIKVNKMYRVEKVLNHNVILGICEKDKQEYLIMGKGIGFGKKIAQRIEIGDEVQVYSLVDVKNAKDTTSSVKEIEPIYLEAANMLLDEAQKRIGEVDRSVLIPLADHIDFAVRRIREQGEISNPLICDIQVLFHMEYKVAEQIVPFLAENSDVSMSESELGYIALHIHSAIAEQNVASSMQVARCVRECINLIEKEIHQIIPITTLSYNRLMNHVRYMVLRAEQGEEIKLNMNDYMELRFKKSYAIATYVCEEMGKILHTKLHEHELGYLSMHIQRCIEEIAAETQEKL